jgi:hypothetical protein
MIGRRGWHVQAGSGKESARGFPPDDAVYVDRMGEPSTDTSRADMEEKLGWARRSLARMRAEAERDQIDLQDHFWAFLHAAHLVWFYFGRWAKANRDAGAKDLVKRWEASLSASDAQVWATLHSLRTTDVHVRPVPTKRVSVTSRITLDGLPISLNGDPIVITQVTHQVEFGATTIDIFDLCERGQEVLRLFIAEFDRL